MARKELDVKIEAEGRDKGKTFHITEMSAWDAERWAQRAFFAVMNAGVDIDDNLAKAGMAGIAVAGIKAFGSIPWEKAQPLLDELLTCVKYRFDHAPSSIRPLVLEDVEEAATLIQLRAEALNLHINFSPLVAPWRSTTISSLTTTAEPNSLNTSTSPQPSGPQFHPAKRRTANSPR